MATNRDIIYRILGEVGDLRKKMAEVEKALDKVSNKTNKTNQAFQTLKKGAQALGIAFGARQLGRFLVSTVKAASDLTESMNAVQVVFGESGESVINFAKDTKDSVFLAASEVNQLAATTGAVLTNFGFSQEEAARQTIELTQRAADMASVYNTDVSQALEAINSALLGQTRPIRQYGADVTETAAKAEALATHIWDGTGAMTTQQKVAAKLQLIMKQTAVTQGDAANTAGEYANQMRHMAELTEEAKVELGEALLPILVDLIPTLTDAATGAIHLGVQLLSAFGSDTAQNILDVNAALEFVATSLEKGSDPAVTFANAIFSLAESGALTADILRRIASAAGVTGQNISGALVTVIEALNSDLDEMSAKGQKGSGDWKALTRAAEDAGQGLEVVRAALAEQILAFDRSDAEIFQLLRQYDLLEFAYKSSAGAARDYTVQLQDVADETEEVAHASDTARTSVEDLAKAQEEAASPMLRFIRASRRLADAQEHLSEVQADQEATASDLEDALLDVVEAQAALNTAGASAASSFTESTQALFLLAEQAGITGDDLDRLLRLYKGLANVRVPKPSGGGGLPNVGGGIKAFQHGGVVPGPTGAAQLAVVHGGETVLPTHKPGGGMGMTVNVYVEGSVRSDDELADVIMRRLATLRNSGGVF